MERNTKFENRTTEKQKRVSNLSTRAAFTSFAAEFLSFHFYVCQFAPGVQPTFNKPVDH